MASEDRSSASSGSSAGASPCRVSAVRGGTETAVWSVSESPCSAGLENRICLASIRNERTALQKATMALPNRAVASCRRRANSNRRNSTERSVEALSQNQVGKKQTMQKALIQGKIPMSIVSHMPKWKLIKASAAPVRTGPVKKGRIAGAARGPRAGPCRRSAPGASWGSRAASGR